MNEIIRIHIAKVPYSIEAVAKPKLDAYLQALEQYLNDPEVLNDVEQRITELLSDRNIKPDGVISAADVAAIEQQLGEPEAFMGEDQSADVSTVLPHRLFRDPQSGILGGVASGIAIFSGVNVIWIRLLLVVAMLASFGTATLIYLVLWLVIPPVKSASDRLQLAGKPVTIPALQAANQSQDGGTKRDAKSVRIVTLLLGIGLGIAVIGTLLVTVVGGFILPFHDVLREGFYGINGHVRIYTLTALFVLSGVLLASLLTVWAYAALTQKLTQKMVVMSLVIIVAGLLSFGAGAGLAYVTARQQEQYVTSHTTNTPVAIIHDEQSPQRMIVDIRTVTVEYTVSDEKPSATLEAFSDAAHSRPHVELSINDGQLTVTESNKTPPCNFAFCRPSTILIQGPALQQISITHGHSITYNGTTQSALGIDLAADTDLSLSSGEFDSVSVTAQQTSVFTALQATIQRVDITNMAPAWDNIGTVADLSINNPNSCPAHSHSTVIAAGISDTLTINKTATSPISATFPCLELNIGNQY